MGKTSGTRGTSAMENRVRSLPREESGQPEEIFGLDPDFVAEIDDALEDGHEDVVRELVVPLHYADCADLIESLHGEHRQRLIELLRPDFNPEVLPELPDDIRDQIVETYGFADFAAIIEELDSDDAVYILDRLDEAEQAHVLARLPIETRTIIEQGLNYPEYSAGRIMQRELVAVPNYWTVGEAIDYLRSNAVLPEDFYVLFVVDPRHRPVGVVRLNRLLRAKRPVKLRDVMSTEMDILPVDMDQEDVAFLFRRKDLLSAPVTDASGRLVGRITIDDIVDVIDEEAEDDILRLAGLSESSIYVSTWETVRNRFTWLLVNLGTAILASLVIGLFEDMLTKVVALAVLMPIVASMGGNAGTQTLTIAVRGLAMKELTPSNAMRILGKELLVGGINGLAFAVLTGAVAWAWFDEPMIGAVIAMAMVINLVIAALVGLLIPLGLERLKIDPAVASGVFLTTVTDVVGFFAFLGLATIFLL
ncbi:Mg transporter [Caenispirillum salinarum AK4]|uniref:Magnesium transporter MgtE n=2 Tax=Caenispirillum TaxID=414051 RepID=K9GWY6_9PROT|nr:Mg transporter [Caenispirillum salinarum AK4]